VSYKIKFTMYQLNWKFYYFAYKIIIFPYKYLNIKEYNSWILIGVLVIDIDFFLT